MSTSKDSFVEIPAGIAVFKEGEVGGELYIIESGQVELVPRAGTALAALGPGDVLGESALLEGQPHFVTALAKTKTRLLRIELAMLPEVLQHNGHIAVSLLRQLAARQLQGEQRLRDLGIELAKFKAATKPESPPRPLEPAPLPPSQIVTADPPQPTVARRWGLQVTGTGQVVGLDPARNDFLVGRPDPVSGATPEIDLGPFDTNRTLSRRHARILREGTQYFVREDSATTNGTYINNERLQTGVNVALKPGDKLRFGSIEVELIAS